MDASYGEAFEALAAGCFRALESEPRAVRVDLDGFCTSDGSGWAGGAVAAEGGYLPLEIPRSALASLEELVVRHDLGSLGFAFGMGRDGAWTAYVNSDPAVVDGQRTASLRIRDPFASVSKTQLPPADIGLIRQRWTAVKRQETRDGATEEELLDTERQLGFALPPELRALLSISNGADAIWDDADEFYEPGPDPIDRCAIMSTSGLLYWRRAYEELWRDLGVERVPTYSDLDMVAPLSWHPGWLLFADENDGVLPRAIDMAPGPAGTPGQIIFLPSEDHEGPAVEATSLAAWLGGETLTPRRDASASVQLQPQERLDLAAVDEHVQGLRIHGPGHIALADLTALPDLRVVSVWNATVDLQGAPSTGVSSLSLFGCTADLRPLADSRTLRALELARPLGHDHEGTLTGLEAIGSLGSLESLTIAAGDLGSVDISGLSALHTLTVVGPHPDAMRALARIRPSLADGMMRFEGSVG